MPAWQAEGGGGAYDSRRALRSSAWMVPSEKSTPKVIIWKYISKLIKDYLFRIEIKNSLVRFMNFFICFLFGS